MSITSSKARLALCIITLGCFGPAACAKLERQLRNPTTGQIAICSEEVMGDSVQGGPGTPYCDCMAAHLKQGFVPVGDPPRGNMCRGLPG
jgi:hypothetical protein